MHAHSGFVIENNLLRFGVQIIMEKGVRSIKRFKKRNSLLTTVALLVALFTASASAFEGASISDPVWDWKYDAIERLVAAAGKTGETVLNTRPYSRIEMARQALLLDEYFGAADGGKRNSRPPNWYHAALLGRLKAELTREIALLRDSSNPETYWKGPRYIRFQGARADIPYQIQNQNGFAVNSYSMRLESSFAVESGTVAAEIRPLLYYKDEAQAGAGLAAGYLQFRKNNWGLEIGRDSMWWGPGRRGADIMSNHAPAFTMLKLQTFEPSDIWLLGSTRALLFIGNTSSQPVQMVVQEAAGKIIHVENREPVIMGFRVDFSPFPWLELGVSHVVQVTNRSGEQYQATDLLQLVVPDWAKNEESGYKGLVNNHLQAVDMALTFGRDAGFVEYLGMEAVKLYIEYGGEAVYFNSSEGLWLQFPQVIYGLHLDFGGTDLRVEYATNSDTVEWYRHYQFTEGYRNDGFVMGHHMGGFAKDLTVDLGFALDGENKVGLHYERHDHFMVGTSTTGGGGDYERILGNHSRAVLSCGYFNNYLGNSYDGAANTVVSLDYQFNF